MGWDPEKAKQIEQYLLELAHEMAPLVEDVMELPVPRDIKINYRPRDYAREYAGRYQNGVIRIRELNLFDHPTISDTKILLAHELAHKAQFDNHPHYAQLWEELDTQHQYRALARLGEGDATWVDQKIGKRFPLALGKIAFHLTRPFSTLFQNIHDGGYHSGHCIVKKLVKQGGRPLVNSLYNAPLEEIVVLFNDERASKALTLF